jgi:hypothetical protein
MIAFVFILFFGLVAAWLVAPKPDPAAAPAHPEPAESVGAVSLFPSS